jgi:hypothetical protein
MKTLKEIVIERKCRRGQADGTTRNGAYWVAAECVTRKWTLELRHHRDGVVRATMCKHAWHQDGAYSGGGDWYYGIDAVLGATTVEDVIVSLKAGVRDKETGDTMHVYGYAAEIEDVLTALGLPLAAPAPDESNVTN